MCSRQLKINDSGFARKVLAVAKTYWTLLGGFARKLFAFKTKFYSFYMGAVADLAEFVFSCNAADFAIRTCATLHLGAFLACDSTNANLHSNHYYYEISLVLLIYRVCQPDCYLEKEHNTPKIGFRVS